MRSLITITLSLLLTSCIVLVDEDGDGFAGCPTFFGFMTLDSLTCEVHDREASVFPGAPEVCDGLDNDLDGNVDEGYDLDGDGHFDGADSGCALAYNGQADCDDADPENFPGNTEACDGADNDCNGVADAADGETDADADGYRTCAGDCRDDRAVTFLGAPEICDGFDNDCDGFTPEVEFDEDGDGEPACEDCDDEDDANFYGNIETCDGQDNDCDGDADAADVDTDADADGYSLCAGDCNDTLALIHPDATEVCDGADNDCDGAEDEGFDQDSDGFTSCAGDCNDGNAAFNPAAEEICDGADNDCSGSPEPLEVDLDSDGWLACAECNDGDESLNHDDLDTDLQSTCDGDCDDENSTTYLAAFEICDGADNDCDGSLPADEQDGDLDGESTCEGDCDDADPFLNNLDADGDTWGTCEGDCDDLPPNGNQAHPGNVSEMINNYSCTDWQDNDCDGEVDYVDEDDCTGACTPDGSAPNTVPDGSFETLPLVWYTVTTDETGGNSPLRTPVSVHESWALDLLNPTVGDLEDEELGVAISVFSGDFHLSFAGMADGSPGISLQAVIRDPGNPDAPLCTLSWTIPPGWASYEGCCSLPSAPSYELVFSHGSQSSVSELYVDALLIQETL